MSSRHRFTPCVTASKRNSRTAIRCHSDKKKHIFGIIVSTKSRFVYMIIRCAQLTLHTESKMLRQLSKKCKKRLQLSVIFCTFAAHCGKVFPDIFWQLDFWTWENLVNFDKWLRSRKLHRYSKQIKNLFPRRGVSIFAFFFLNHRHTRAFPQEKAQKVNAFFLIKSILNQWNRNSYSCF